MKKLALSLITLFLGSFVLAQDVTVTYWQYEFAAKVEALDELIERFEAENPGILCCHRGFLTFSRSNRFPCRLI